MAKSKRYKPYVPPPLPIVSDEEARALERQLRTQINTWGLYPRDPEETDETHPLLRKVRPGFNWQKKITEALLPIPKPKNRRKHP